MDDLSSIHALWIDEHVRRFLFDDNEVSLDDARSFLEASLDNFENHGYGLWLVFAGDNELAGFVGFLSSEDEAPNLIYGIDPRFCGCGYATEAASAVLNYGLEKLALPKVKADVDEPNEASVRVLEKLGMKLTHRAEVEGRPLLYFEILR
jgi:RimJ/RimL family protein N-acetyltransferase